MWTRSLRHVGPGVVDVMVVNATPVAPRCCARYAEEGAEPVVWDREK